MGDLYGQGGVAVDDGEVATLDSNNDDEDISANEDEDGSEDEDEDEDEDTISDSRDEQDNDLVDHRAEFFSQFGEDFEPNDD
jgi:hypothetical protein